MSLIKCGKCNKEFSDNLKKTGTREIAKLAIGIISMFLAATIFYWFATLFSTGNSSTYKYSLFWGSIAFCFGLINLGEFLPIHVKNTKNRYLLIIFIAVVSIAFFVYSFNWDIIFGYEHLGRLLWYIIFD